jgi:hypothetical protein
MQNHENLLIKVQKYRSVYSSKTDKKLEAILHDDTIADCFEL